MQQARNDQHTQYPKIPVVFFCLQPAKCNDHGYHYNAADAGGGLQQGSAAIQEILKILVAFDKYRIGYKITTLQF